MFIPFFLVLPQEMILMKKEKVVALKTVNDDQRKTYDGRRVRDMISDQAVERLARQVLLELELRYEFSLIHGVDPQIELERLETSRRSFLDWMYKIRNCQVQFWIIYGTARDRALDETTCQFITHLAQLTVNADWGVITGGAATGIMGHTCKEVHLAMLKARKYVPVAGIMLDFFAGEILGQLNPEKPSRYLNPEYTTPPLPNILQRQDLFHIPRQITLEVMTWGGAGTNLEISLSLVKSQMRKLVANNKTHLPGSELPPFLIVDLHTKSGWAYEAQRQHFVNQIAYQAIDDETFGRVAFLRIGYPCIHCGAFNGNHKKCGLPTSSVNLGPSVYHFQTARQAAEAAFALHASVGRFL